MIADELEKLHRLRETNALSEAEFVAAKQRLLFEGASPKNADTTSGGIGRIHGVKQDTWIMLMHLSQLLIFAGGIGFAAPILMWAISKDESREADRHGLMIINWLLSVLAYLIVGGILSIVLIGVPMVIALCVVTIVFPIVGAIKASRDEFWSYPLTITFFDARWP